MVSFNAPPPHITLVLLALIISVPGLTGCLQGLPPMNTDIRQVPEQFLFRLMTISALYWFLGSDSVRNHLALVAHFEFLISTNRFSGIRHKLFL